MEVLAVEVVVAIGLLVALDLGSTEVGLVGQLAEAIVVVGVAGVAVAIVVAGVVVAIVVAGVVVAIVAAGVAVAIMEFLKLNF